MTYFIALIAIAIIVFLCWKAFGPQSALKTGRTSRTTRVTGPDDDPEFLWRISRRQQHQESDPDTGDPT